MRARAVGAAAAGASVGVILSIVFWSGTGISNAAPDNAVEFPVNESGWTYGSVEDSEGLQDAPDLISTIGDDGKTIGFIFRSELFPKPPSTPEEVAEAERKARVARTVPLYESDGVTVIGTFTIVPGEVITEK